MCVTLAARGIDQEVDAPLSLRNLVACQAGGIEAVDILGRGNHVGARLLLTDEHEADEAWDRS